MHAALALLIAASLVGGAAPSSAQTVPVPKPAPKGARRHMQMSASERKGRR